MEDWWTSVVSFLCGALQHPSRFANSVGISPSFESWWEVECAFLRRNGKFQLLAFQAGLAYAPGWASLAPPPSADARKRQVVVVGTDESREGR